ARRGGGGADRLHPDHRRLCHPGADRRRQDPDDRQYDPGADARPRQPADGLGAGGDRHADRGGHQPGLHRPEPPLPEGAAMKGGGLRAYALIYLLFLYAPILLLPIFAFNSGTIIAFPLRGFTTEWFAQMWGNASLRRALTNSLTIAVSASILATCLGVFAARASTRFTFPGK